MNHKEKNDNNKLLDLVFWPMYIGLITVMLLVYSFFGGFGYHKKLSGVSINRQVSTANYILMP